MINWLHQEDGYCEGNFQSVFFRDDLEGDELTIMAKSPELEEGAIKCVEAFNGLTESKINEICTRIVEFVKNGDMDYDFDLSDVDNERDILKYCWFTTIYVNMLNNDDEISFVVEGEGEWGDSIGFAFIDGEIVYVGNEYFDYMKDE